MIVVLAGRRIDKRNAEEKRFPLEMKEIVYVRIRDFFHNNFHNNKVEILVSSGACGADLLAQKAARELKIERHIIIPFEREKFRKTSVIDRPGNWGKLFDELCDETERAGNLIVLEGFEDEEENAYSAVTIEILEHAKAMPPGKENLLAVAVWEGKAKDEMDETASFIKQAKIRKIRTAEILITSY